MTSDETHAKHAVVDALESYGGFARVEGPGVLAAIFGGDIDGEGHFRVDPEPEGCWTVWGTPMGSDKIVVEGPVGANALAALASDVYLEMRAAYATQFGLPIPAPVPPAHIRLRKKEFLAEEAVAQAIGGRTVTAGNHGYDVLGPDGTRVQVKSSVRNERSGRISTLAFAPGPAYTDHDQLVYVEFSSLNYPVRAWLIGSDQLRSAIPGDGKTHHSEPVLQQHGADFTEPVQLAFETLFMGR